MLCVWNGSTWGDVKLEIFFIWENRFTNILAQVNIIELNRSNINTNNINQKNIEL